MKKSLLVIVLTALLLAACQASGASPTATDAMMEEHAMGTATDAMMDDHAMGTATDDMMDHSMGTETMDSTGTAMGTDTMMETPAFFDTTFTEVTSGDTFKISDFSGKVVVVENMAQWCPTCLSEQKQVKAFLEQLGMPDDLVMIGLDIDPNENAATLKDYVASNGFGWKYAVAPADVTREMSDKFSAQFLNPPSVPMFIVDRHGEVHLLPFGIKSADDLQQTVQPLLDAGM